MPAASPSRSRSLALKTMNHNGLARLARRSIGLGILLLTLPAMLLGQGGTAASAAAKGRRTFSHSITSIVPGERSVRSVRNALTRGEIQAPMDFNISLRMRNFDELQARIQSGETISPEEMNAKYLPLQSDYDRTVAWLISEGFTITLADSNHANIFARGSVAGVAKSLGVTFVRVTTEDGDFTSAVTAPSLPADIAEPVLDVGGLQPHIRMHPPRRLPQPAAVISAGGGYYTPADIAAAYSVPSNLTGAGQTIAVIADANVQTSDLATFWNTTGVAQTTANFTTVPVNGGAVSSVNSNESSMDVEWSGALAPGAGIRLYAMPSTNSNNFLAALTQILNDAKANAGLRVISYSYGSAEYTGSSSFFNGFTQNFALVAAAGITMCASSGDGGSNPGNPSSGTAAYAPSNPLSVDWPASDPNVTAVGGTTVNFDQNYNYNFETAWFDSSTPASGIYSGGGGSSAVFFRPTWQAGVPFTGNGRLLPDVALVADGANPFNLHFGSFCVLNGRAQGGGGTSLATPVFAGIVAIINQARAKAGGTSLGLLGPSIYPLVGTKCFTDITVGSNGSWPARVGYDLCTGMGSPNVANLIAALASTRVVPAFAVDGHKSGDTVSIPTGSTLKVTARFIAADPANQLTGIRYNIWNPPPGSVTPFAGSFNNNGGAFVSTAAGSGEVDQSVTLTPGDWYFWTDARNSNLVQAGMSAWTGGFVLHVVSNGSAAGATANSPLAAVVTVDGYNSGNTIVLPAGGTASVTIRHTGIASGGDLAGIRMNVWNPPAGSLVPFAGSFTNGSGFISASGGLEEIIAKASLTPGDWYFWTDATNKTAIQASSGAWSSGFLLHVVQGP